jgi:hypothetical protein
MGSDFRDSDETAKIVKTVEAEEHAKGVMARTLPDAVTGTARDRWRRSGRATAFDQDATAQVVRLWKVAITACGAGGHVTILTSLSQVPSNPLPPSA